MDFETALACYHSPEYAKAKEFRQGRADMNIVIVEGYDGPQPQIDKDVANGYLRA